MRISCGSGSSPACSFLFVAFTFTGLEIFWPQPPSFALSAEQTAAYYVEHRTGFLVGVVMCSIGMAFLLAWTVQVCLMLWRLEGGSRAVTAVTVANALPAPSCCPSTWPYSELSHSGRAEQARTSPARSAMWHGLAHNTSGPCWPPMALAGILIVKTQGRSGSLPLAWLLQPRGRSVRIRATSHFLLQDRPISGNGVGAWYLATFTWCASIWPPAGDVRVLGRQQAERVNHSERSDVGSLGASAPVQ